VLSATKNGASFLQFTHLADLSGIRHGVFTRNAGYSKPPFNSLNVSFGIGDDQRHVKKNRGLIARCIGADGLVFARQVHGNRVLVFARAWQGQTNFRGGPPLIGDAMVTDIPKKFLVVQVADCQSVLMYDPVRQVIANVHCGWRGTISNIIGCTVDALIRRFRCEPANLKIGIGPSLGPCCAEFINYKTEIPRAFWRYKDANHHFDFWSISCDQLVSSGVRWNNIESSRICTRCRPDLFFSYRGEGTTGRIAAVIGLK
jgi:YfiH family protein